jgi:hypothetical protein
MPKRTSGDKHGKAKKSGDVNQPVRESTEPPDFETAAIDFLSQLKSEIGSKEGKVEIAGKSKPGKKPKR